VDHSVLHLSQIKSNPQVFNHLLLFFCLDQIHFITSPATLFRIEKTTVTSYSLSQSIFIQKATHNGQKSVIEDSNGILLLRNLFNFHILTSTNSTSPYLLSVLNLNNNNNNSNKTYILIRYILKLQIKPEEIPIN